MIVLADEDCAGLGPLSMYFSSCSFFAHKHQVAAFGIGDISGVAASSATHRGLSLIGGVGAM